MNKDFEKRCEEYFSEKKDAFLKTLDNEPTHGFFLNASKAKKEDILKLIDFAYQSSNINPNAYYHNEDSIGKTKAFELGLIYPQDIESSISISLFEADNINLIVDLCAAPGGKTINILNKFKNALCITNDVNYKRASELAKNLERLGLTNTVITSKDCNKLSNELLGNADLVVLDAPCSGEGMIRKYKEILNTYDVNRINELANIQKELLEDAYNLINENGYILYSTCTYALEEDEKQIKTFLDNHNDMELIPLNIKDNYSKLDGTVKLCPLNNTEGQFICLLKRNSINSKTKVKILKSIKNKVVDNFIKDNLNINDYYLYESNNNFYLSFKPLFDLGQGTIRSGIYLGTLKNNRFEPSHNLYRSNQLIGKYKYTYELNDEEYDVFVKGLELKLNLANAYYLLTYKNNSLGFGKVSSNILKNKYPKGLRRL